MLLKYETDVLAAEAGQRVALHGAHILPGEHHRARRGAVERTHYLEEGRLARAAGAHDAHDLALVHMEVYAAKHLEISKTLMNVPQIYHRPDNRDKYVHLIGLEPTQPKLPDPKSGASTNSATDALN